jgi:hypothetical protein
VEWLVWVVSVIGAVGIGGWINSRWERRFAAKQAEMQREHASAEARAARRFQVRLEAYKEASHDLSKHELWVNLTEPVSTAC